MRALFIKTIVVLGLCGCGSNSYHTNNNIDDDFSPLEILAIKVRGIIGVAEDPSLDLRYPVYLVPDKTFWNGCPNPSKAEGVTCRSARVAEIEKGVSQWLDYFPKNNVVPIITIVSSTDLPLKPKNRPVYLKIDLNGCKNVTIPAHLTLLACYVSTGEIVFIKSKNITPRVMAHELGHALGVHHTTLVNLDHSPAIMSEPIQSDYVTPLDILFLCGLHPEIECPLPVKEAMPKREEIKCRWQEDMSCK